MVALCTLAISGSLAAQAKPQIVQRVPSATDGDDPVSMFREYCAACHGPEGKGNGPAAPALKTVPADLTRISARNGGKFPDTKVRRYIEGLDQIPAHVGTAVQHDAWRTVSRCDKGSAAQRLHYEDAAVTQDDRTDRSACG